ncbi:hypothetical protein DMUE_4506 [Dictyocoela muelleri]|nr:hypothetical protein DMUE_4506 [Dictyocoela muelleri]
MNSLPKQKNNLKAKKTVFIYKSKRLSISFEVRLEHLENANEQDTLAWVSNTKIIFEKIDLSEEEKNEILDKIIEAKIIDKIKGSSSDKIFESIQRLNIKPYMITKYLKDLQKTLQSKFYLLKNI